MKHTSTPPVSSREAVFASCRDVAGDIVEYIALKYSVQCQESIADKDDIESDIWLRLWNWLLDDRHSLQMEALLEDTGQARAFLTQFAKARACDHIDVMLAGNRDQRLTLHASGYGQSGQLHKSSQLDILAHVSGQAVPPDTDFTIEAVRARLPADAALLFDYLLEYPSELRESFCDARMYVKRGMATLTESSTARGQSVVHLNVLEGSQVAEYHVTFSGPLPARGGMIETDHGPARVSFHDRRTTCVIRWTEARIVVRLNLPENEGEFSREVVRPSPSVFETKPAAENLGLSDQRTRFAWKAIQDALSAEGL